MSALEQPSASSLHLALKAIQELLEDAETTEICVNTPGQVFVESRCGWTCRQMPALDLDWCRRFAKLVAHDSHQRVDETSPLLSASLPGGERLQLVMAPATSHNTVCICIRKPSRRTWTVQELGSAGVFRRTCRANQAGDTLDEQLNAHLANGEFEQFMRLAVRGRKNILVSGPTGSGKTTWTRALIGEIPTHERLVTIEDAAELNLSHHPNHVRLFYSKDGQGTARTGVRQLLECSLRLRPDRILLAELRSDEAFEYLRSVNSGHPGAITSIHATSAELAFEQLMLLVKQSAAGRDLSRDEIRQLLYVLVDIVVQFDHSGSERFIKEIWFEPGRRGAFRAQAA